MQVVRTYVIKDENYGREEIQLQTEEYEWLYTEILKNVASGRIKSVNSYLQGVATKQHNILVAALQDESISMKILLIYAR